MIINHYSPGSKSQKWALDGDTLRCVDLNIVADVKGSDKRPGASVIAYTDDGGTSQKWKFRAR